jgi:hypothetical protein
MKIKSIFLFLFVLSIFSCGELKKEAELKGLFTNDIKDENKLPYHINLPSSKKSGLNLSFFADSVVYIPLETNKKSLLRRIAQVRMDDSIIGVSDMRNLFLFKKDGTFIRAVGRKGKGPAEHLYINNFFLKEDTVCIVSARKVTKHKIDGSFLGENLVNFDSQFFSLSPSDNLVCFRERQGVVFFYDRAFNVRDTLRIESNVSPGRGVWISYDPTDNFFQLGNGKLLFTNYKSDTIWNLAEAKKKAEYILNLKGELLPCNLQVEYFRGDFERYEKAVGKYQKVNLMELSNYVFILKRSWIEKDLNTIYIHNLKDQTTIGFSPFIYDDLIGKIKLPCTRTYNTGDDFITAVTATELVESLNELNKEKSPTDIKHDEWKVRMSRIKYDDNPILVVIKPRKFHKD